VWLAAGVLLVGGTAWGMLHFEGSVRDARKDAFRAELVRAIDDPRPNMDVDILEEALLHVDERSLDENIDAADDGGLVVRRLPYSNSGFGMTAFLAVVTGLFSLLFGLRLIPSASPLIDRMLRGAAVPAIS